MEKRLILFIVLSFLILYIQSIFLPKKKTEQIKPSFQKEEIKKGSGGGDRESGVGSLESGVRDQGLADIQKAKEEPILPLIDEEELVFKNGLFSSTLSQKGTIKALNLLKFNDRKGNPYTIIKDNETFSIFLEGKEIFPTEFSNIGFVYDLESFKIIKEYEFSTKSYLFTVNLSFINKELRQITLPEVSLLLNSSLGNDPELLRESPFLYRSSEKTNKVSFKNGIFKTDETINWLATQDKYFLFVVIPKMRFSSILFSKEDKNFGVMASFPKYSLKAGEVLENKIGVYAGPRDYKTLKKVGLGSLSGLWFLPKFLLFCLVFLYNLVKNYGLAIIILTIFIKLILHPLTRKNFMMMKKMSSMKPHIDKLKEKHKDDFKAIQEETMKLYKEHNVNPFGGCLPLILQMPVFFALYVVFDKAIELRGAPFILWINDLSLKDPYFVLPILMGITMLIQQKMTPSTQQDPSMEKMMLIMPIVMTFVFLNFPSGLVLYWLIQNILTIVEHWAIEKGIEK